jgi:phytoene dehydrogenase-like protein
VKGGIWRITEELGQINADLGVTIHLSSSLVDIDANKGRATYVDTTGEQAIDFDYLIMGTDPLTAARSLVRLAICTANSCCVTSGKLAISLTPIFPGLLNRGPLELGRRSTCRRYV